MNKINAYQENGYATILNCTIREPVFKLKTKSKIIKESEEIIFPYLENDSIKNKSKKENKTDVTK